MTSQPMKPSEAKCKLQCDLAEHEGALRRLELERVRLALPASSGDRTAVERLRSIRVEITEKTGMVEDLQQALVDIEPQVASPACGRNAGPPPAGSRRLRGRDGRGGGEAGDG